MTRFAQIGAWAALALLLVAWLNGLSELALEDRFAVPWTDRGLVNLGLFSLGFSFLAFLIELRPRRNAFGLYAGIGLLCAISSVGAGPVFAVVFLAVSCLVLGHWIVSRFLDFDDVGKIKPLLEILLGASVLVTILAPAMWLRIHYPPVYVAALALPLWLCPERAFAVGSFLESLRSDPTASWATRCTRCAVAYFLFLYLTFALQPEAGHDALTIHLAVPALVSSNHSWAFDVSRHIWAVMPLSSDWLYTWTYMLGGEFASRLTNYACLLLVVGVIYRLAKQQSSPTIAGLVTLMFLSTPLVLLETGSLFVENFQTALILGAAASIWLLGRTSNNSYAYMGSALLGTSLSVKVGSSGFVVIAIVALVICLYRSRSGPLMRVTLVSLGLVLLFGSFPFVNAALVTGNPIYPFEQQLFESNPPDLGALYPNPHFAQGLTADALYRVTFDSGKYLEGTSGSAGFTLLVLLPMALIFSLVLLDEMALLFGAMSLAFVVSVFSGMAYLRYVYAALPLLFLIMPSMFEYVSVNARKMFYALVSVSLVSVMLNLLYLPSSGWIHRDFDIRVSLDEHSREEFITTRIPVRRAVRTLNALGRRDLRVAFLGGWAPIAELDGEAFRTSWHDYEFWSALKSSESVEERLALIAGLKISHFITDETDRFDMLPVIERLAEPIAKFDPITLWKTNNVIRVSEELLSNNEFATGTEGWSGEAEYRSEFGSVMVSVDQSLFQVTPVDDDKTYVLEVRARCGPESASFRLQANWLGEDGAILSPSIAVRNCRPEFTHEVFQIEPPEQAEYAVVYANSHTSSYVEIDSVSLRSGIVNDH